MALGVKKDGVIIHIRDVDAEVAKFWGTECDDDSYSSYIKKEDYIKDGILQEYKYLRDKMLSDWFHVLGYQIEKSKGAITDWDAAFTALIDSNMELTYTKENNTSREQMIEMYKPYLDLAEHFKSLGWVPFYDRYN
jgi:hypothetical protein